MLRLQGFRARHFTRPRSYGKKRGGWCASPPHGIVGAPLLFLPGVLWCALFKRAHVTVAASFKVRLSWICISQRLTGRAICRPKKKKKKTMLTNKLAALPIPQYVLFKNKKKNTMTASRKTKLVLKEKMVHFQLLSIQSARTRFQSGLAQRRHTSQPSRKVQ